MGRKNAATFGAFEPIEDSFKLQDDMVITCTDFEVLSNGKLGSRTEYLRNLPTMIAIDHAAEQHRPSSTSQIEEAECEKEGASDWLFTEPVVDDMRPVALDSTVDEVGEPGPAIKKEKRSKYTPIPRWTTKRDRFLIEMLRLEGRGDFNDRCSLCQQPEPAYRCTHCMTQRLLCQRCVVDSHHCNPLHVIEKWTDNSYFEQVSLSSLGLVIQLGHPDGQGCDTPKKPHSKNGFVVMDVCGIQEVTINFCGCLDSQPHFVQILRYGWYPASIDRPQTAATNTLLKFFHLLSLQSKISMYEFYRTLALLSDNTGLKPVKDRYEAFVIMIREWKNLKMLKRGGRGHQAGGVSGTQRGELAVLCPACPQPGMNMRPGWEKCTSKQRFLHTLFLAIDANFRLKRRNVSNEAKDPSLSDGWSYFVPRAEYRSYLEKFDRIIEQEKSTCSHYKAVDAERRNSPGFSTTGILAVDCARHDMKRPSAVGDLEHGERYVNTDFMFWLSLLGSEHLDIIASYDICCQWRKRIWDRNEKYPTELRIPEDRRSTIRFLVPKFHLPSHIMKCQTRYSFNFAKGVGRTDGESPERCWSQMNAIAPSTTEMGPGSRQDTLDDQFAGNNWIKTIEMPEYLDKRLEEAAEEAEAYRIMYNEFASGVEKKKRQRWLKALKDWEEDEKRPNPFEKRFAVMTEQKVRKRLEEEEKGRGLREPQYVLHEQVSAVALISMGLNLEDQQRQLSVKWTKGDLYASQKRMLEGRMAILKDEIQAWIKIQHRYTPALAAVREREAQEHPLTASEPTATSISLHLPSATVASSCQGIPQDDRLLRIEYQLRSAQADDALHQLRDALRLRTYVYHDKDRFQFGQKRNLRSRTLVSRLEAKVAIAAAKYRSSREAISHLAPILQEVEWDKTFPHLAETDIRALNDDDLPIYMRTNLKYNQKKRLFKITSKKNRKKSSRELSWIWKRLGAHRSVAGDDICDDDLRIEFCKGRARAERWKEEVLLLQEEMDRVKRFFKYRSDCWDKLGASEVTQFDAATQEGLKAYARQQAHMFKAMRDRCEKVWGSLPRYSFDKHGKIVKSGCAIKAPQAPMELCD